MTTKTITISRAQMTALRDEAAAHGDSATVRLCDRALDGIRVAQAQVQEIIREAAARA
jgi:hypothetical protein